MRTSHFILLVCMFCETITEAYRAADDMILLTFLKDHYGGFVESRD